MYAKWNSKHPLQNFLGCITQHEYCHLKFINVSQFPTRAEPSILEKNSSRHTAVSEPDHLGTKEIKDRSLWTVGISMETRSLSRCNSALFSTNSAFIRASAMFKNYVSVLYKISNFPALAVVTMP